jgi:hypothetical protein
MRICSDKRQPFRSQLPSLGRRSPWRQWTVLVLLPVAAAILLTVYPDGPASAQTLTISGAIPCAGRLEAAGSSAVPAESDARHTVAFPLPGPAGDRVPLRVSLRSNCGYDLSAQWVGPPGSTVRLEEGSVSPVNGGAHLARHALSASIKPGEAGTDRLAVWVSGPVISRGGNDSTSDNAIWVDLVVSLSASSAAGSVVLKLNLHR